MWGYVGRRLLAFIPTVFVAVTLIFILTRLVPGNPVWALLGHQSVSAEQVDAVAREMGLDRPILIQYLNWLPRVLSGNFGQSIFYEQPVAAVIAQRFPVTLSIAGLSTVVTVLVAVPMGVLAATRRDSALDHASMVVSILGVSIPSFWLGFLFILLFAVTLGWFPAAGYRDLSFGLWEWLRRLVLPVLALSLSQLALLLRITRTSMLEVLGQEYIVAARAKGLAEGKVIYKHALRNGLMSITTIVGLVFALTLGGSVIIEEVFAIPGLGRLITDAAVRRDYPTLEGGMAYLTLIALAVNLLVDLSYSLINPRVRYE